MKRNFLTLLFSLVVGLSQAQNGGMANENASLKLEHISTINGVVMLKVTNKDTCSANISVQWGNFYVTKNINATSADTFNMVQQTARFIMVRSNSPCRGYQGQVELDYMVALPVTFEYINVKQVSERVVNVQFKVAESDGTDRFNIQISKDGKNFRTIQVVLPDTIQTNRIYNVNVKL